MHLHIVDMQPAPPIAMRTASIWFSHAASRRQSTRKEHQGSHYISFQPSPLPARPTTEMDQLGKSVQLPADRSKIFTFWSLKWLIKFLFNSLNSQSKVPAEASPTAGNTSSRWQISPRTPQSASLANWNRACRGVAVSLRGPPGVSHGDDHDAGVVAEDKSHLGPAQSGHGPDTSDSNGSDFIDSGQFAERTLREIRSPTLGTYGNLKRRLAQCSPKGMRCFLESQGLDLLLDSLHKLTLKKNPTIVNAVLQVQCVDCVKAVMDSQIGLNLIIENKDYIQKLATGEWMYDHELTARKFPLNT